MTSQTRPHWHVAFAGQWILKRQIWDRFSQQRLTFEGFAWFKPEGDILHYAEKGEIRIPGQTALPASQNLTWRPESDDGENIAVYFHDGRYFHSLNPRQSPISARHLCGRDLYDVTYRFEDWPTWDATWVVTGPAKDYTLASTYLPC